MVSAAAGSVALVAAAGAAARAGLFAGGGLLAGAVQVAFGLMKLGVLMRFVSSLPVRTGFLGMHWPS